MTWTAWAMDGVEERPSNEFHTFPARLRMEKGILYIPIPRIIGSVLRLKDKDLVQVAIRPICEEECKKEFNFLPRGKSRGELKLILKKRRGRISYRFFALVSRLLNVNEARLEKLRLFHLGIPVFCRDCGRWDLVDWDWGWDWGMKDDLCGH